MKILNRYTRAVLYEDSADTIAESVLAAINAGADLGGAYLGGANLGGTALDTTLRSLLRTFTKQCPCLRTGGRIVWRTARSQHVGATEYTAGRTYVSPLLSFSAETACHPGIYAGSLQWMQKEYPSQPLVRCYVRDGDWVISAKGAIRCERLRVLGAHGG